MDNNNSNMKFTVILLMGLLTAIGPFSIDMYLPAFPDIAKTLHTTVSEVTLSLSSFFIGISAGQLLYGPLLERYGRKPPLYVGLSLYFLACVGCAAAQSVHILIVLRLFQAIGGCVGMVAARAMVRDLFEVKETPKVFSMLMLVVSVSPIIAPTAGGYITAALGWRWVFVVLIIIVSVILAGTYFYLPESKQPDPSFSLKPLPILRNFQSVLKNPHFLTFALTGSISYAGLYAYIGGAPHIFMEIFKVTEAQFGWIFAIIAMGLIGASQANNLALLRYRSEQIIKVASFSQCIIGIGLLCITLSGFSNLYLTVFMIFIFLACQGFIFPNSTALALAPLGHNAGNASALIGAIQMTIGASASALVGVFQNRSGLPMPLIMTSCSITAFIVFTFGKKILIGRIGKEAVQEQDVEMIELL
jgi:DHA1 family bicyclomycin/chloramphenicol resistance-like MFS transporter